MYSFLHNVQVMQWITIAEVHVKRSVILTDRLEPDILLAFWTKGQVLHRKRAFESTRPLSCSECAFD